MQGNGVAGNLLQTYTANGAHLCAEVAAQQVFTQSDTLEDLRTTIGTDGRYTHLRHNLLQTLIHSLDIVFLGCSIFLLNLSTLHQVVEDGEGHIRTQCAGTIAQQQGRMHRLANLATLHDKSRLHTLAHTNQIVVYGRDSQERRDTTSPDLSQGGEFLADFLFAVGENDVIVAIIHSLLCIFTQLIKGIA